MTTCTYCAINYRAGSLHYDTGYTAMNDHNRSCYYRAGSLHYDTGYIAMNDHTVRAIIVQAHCTMTQAI